MAEAKAAAERAELMKQKMAIRRQIAKRLARDAFAPPKLQKESGARRSRTPGADSAQEQLEELLSDRREHSAQLVAEAKDDHIYTVELEQRRSLGVALEAAMPRIVAACELWCDARRGDEIELLRAALLEMESCLGRGFGGR